MASTDIGTIYAGALRNTRALERQGLEQMERQLSGLERYPDYAAVLRRHVETTKGRSPASTRRWRPSGRPPRL